VAQLQAPGDEGLGAESLFSLAGHGPLTCLLWVLVLEPEICRHTA